MKFFNKNLTGKFTLTAMAIVMSGLVEIACSDLWSEQHPGTYYINSGETIATWLTNREEEYSDFIYCLDVANVWGEMRTYGGHTCFAPDNNAFKEYLHELFPDVENPTVQMLRPGQCDTVAKTHLCNALFFCKDLDDGAFPYPNLLDRYLTYNVDSVPNNSDSTSWRVIYKVNKVAEITLRDDTVQNGVVHKVNKVINPSNDFLPDVMQKDSTITIFYDAMVLTKIADTICKYYLDESYKEPQYDSTLLCFQTTGKTAVQYKTSYETDNAIWPDKRFFKFTAFIPQDKVLKEKYGVESLADLRTLAHNIYGDTVFTDIDGNPVNTYDTLAHPNNSLNKFISYHILPEELAYNKLNLLFKEITDNYKKWSVQDVEDFYETTLAHSIMRISTPYVDKGHRYINRKGIEGDAGFIPGIMVIDPKGIDATSLNGVYHYLEDILVYDEWTKTNPLNIRMRIMCNTMSPDFINSGATGRYGGKGENEATKDRYVVGFRQGKSKNFIASEESEFYVRYADSGFGCYMGYEMTMRGIYDVKIKLPPVPYSGTYEVRMFMNTMASSNIGSDRGIVQIYFRQGNKEEDWKACDIPLDLTIAGKDARIGNVKDSDSSIGNDEAKIQANEKAMRNRGYMKAPNSYYGGSNLLRDDVDCLRRILTTEFMYDNMDYWIRLRLVQDNPNAVCPFNFIEIVPKAIYAGNTPEDRY